MYREFFQALESLADQESLPLDEVIENLSFDDNQLVPVITQDANSKDVLMFAWMNKESLRRTLATRRMTYWSRSRQDFWVKGETSGHTQELVSMAFDCDGDAILCMVDQSGAACHTGRPDCFYLKVDIEGNRVLIVGDTPEI